MSNKPSNLRFASRWGFLLSALGVAIGTGNIWRFPRILAQNGGENGAGAFILAWVVFLLLWSIPLIIAEYAIGITSRKGVVGSIMDFAGKKFAWMGAFMTWIAMAITFFYSVVLGWCIFYFVMSITSELPVTLAAAQSNWEVYQSSFWPIITHGVVMLLGAIAIWKGIRRIERINTWLMPILLVIILIALVRSLTLDGAREGIRYIFTFDASQLTNGSLWVAALTQNAWDTGAGWGLFITYGAYMQMRFGIVKNAVITAVGNNVISLVCGIMIFGTCFAILGEQMGQNPDEVLTVMRDSGPASTGLTFIWMPQLFEKMMLGRPMAILFFLGLAMAGFSSMISQLEMTTRTLVDSGVSRPAAIVLIIGVSYLLGIPSAVNLNILANQDFVWGLALLFSGAICAFAVIRYGPGRIRQQILNKNKNDISVHKLWEYVLGIFVPLASGILLIWWLLGDGMTADWYNPFSSASMATCLVQWAVIIGILLVMNKLIIKRNTSNLED